MSKAVCMDHMLPRNRLMTPPNGPMACFVLNPRTISVHLDKATR